MASGEGSQVAGHYLSEAAMAKLYPTRDTDTAPGDSILAIT